MRHEGVKRMVVGFAVDGDRLAGEGSPGARFTRAGTSSDRSPTGHMHIQTEKAFAIPAAFWSMGFGNLALDLLR